MDFLPLRSFRAKDIQQILGALELLFKWHDSLLRIIEKSSALQSTYPPKLDHWHLATPHQAPRRCCSGRHHHVITVQSWCLTPCLAPYCTWLPVHVIAEGIPMYCKTSLQSSALGASLLLTRLPLHVADITKLAARSSVHSAELFVSPLFRIYCTPLVRGNYHQILFDLQ